MKAQNGEPYACVSHMASTATDTPHRRGMHRQKFIRHVLLLVQSETLLRKAVRRGHLARQWLDELPKSEKEKKEDVAKLMALTN